MSVLYHSYVLPWTPIPAEDQRLRRAIGIALAFSLVAGLVLPFLPVPEAPRQAQQMPSRLAQLVLQKRALPPPPPPEKVEAEKKKPEEKKEEKKKEEKKKEEKKPEPVSEEKPVEAPKPVKNVEAAREKAKAKMQSLFGDDLNDLREAPAVVKKGGLDTPLVQSGGQASTQDFNRKLLTSGTVAAGSGGYDPTKLSSGVTRSQSLGTHKTQQVEDPVAAQVAKAAQTTEIGASGKKRRSQESVQLALEKAKSALYKLYNRALREDPTLEGKVVFEITVGSDGKVISAKVLSSELKSPELEEKLLRQLRITDFGALEGVDSLTVTAPYDFLPAS